MAYITTPEIRAIREALKAKFGPLGFKFGVRNADHMKAIVTVLSGPTDFADILRDGYADINPYYMGNYGEHKKFFEEIETIIKTAPAAVTGRKWFDNSDAQIDYFEIAYYYGIGVGHWDKPYVCTKIAA